MRIDSMDFGILLQMYQWAPTMIELDTDTPKRVYRLSRAGLCRCDTPGMHPGQPRCWSLLPLGTSLVERIDAEQGQAWRKRGWAYEWSKVAQAKAQEGGG